MAEEALQPPQAQPMTRRSWFMISFSILWCWLIAWAFEFRAHSFLDAEVLGRATGTLLFPFLIAYALRGRKSKRDWNSFARWFFWLALILPALSYNLQSSQRAADTRAARELTRQFIQEVRALQTRYASDPRCEFEPVLYSAASFANTRAMAHTIEQLDDCLALYVEMDIELEALVSRTEARGNSMFSSSEFRHDWQIGFRNGYEQTSAQRKHAAAARQRWKVETTALYEFALRSAEQIHVKNEEVIISSDSVLAQFNNLMNKATEAHDEVVRIEATMYAAGQSAMESAEQELK